MVRLSERLRLRRPVEVAAPVVENSGPEPRPADEPVSDIGRDLPVGRLAREDGLATQRLYDRLGEAEIREAERLLHESPEFQAHMAGAEPGLRRMFTLHCLLWHRLDSAIEQTGLIAAQPPEEVHAMARGAWAAAGGLYEADLIADALASAGSDIANAGYGLDFGCSSGRVVRVLAAAFPEVRWAGCDPNGGAIAWARQNLPGIEFFTSGNEPPLRLEDGALGLAFGISVWSHFERALGLAWFDEMRRLLRPGGHLVITTHGVTSVRSAGATGQRPAEQVNEIARALSRSGWWYAAEFGEAGDWGVVDPRWGTAFLTPEWLLSQLCPQWRVLEFASGRNAGNQDVYVLERV